MGRLRYFGLFAITLSSFICYAGSVSMRHASGGSAQQRLLDFLFDKKRYNKMERPVEVEEESLVVKFNPTLQQIIDVDEKNQNVFFNVWLSMEWTAYNLRWDPVDFGNITIVRVDPKMVWKPDILLYNSADEAFDGTYHTNVLVTNTGYISYIPPGMFRSTCTIDIQWFPFDEQKCPLKFGSWTYDLDYIDLQPVDPNGGDISSFMPNGEWTLKGMPVERNVIKYDCCATRYVDLTYYIYIRRRTLYHMFSLVIPCVMISSMTLLVFLLPPDAGEKISLGVTILLSLMVFLLLVAETMPPTSNTLPLIGIYFVCIMMMSSVSLLITVIVLNFHYRGPVDMPLWIRRLLLESVASCVGMRRVPEFQPEEEVPKRNPHALSSRSHEIVNGALQTELNRLWEPRRANGDVFQDPVPTDLASIAGLKTVCQNIEKDLQQLTDKIRQTSEDDLKAEEWRYAAKVLDRFSLIVFTAFAVISTLTVMLAPPTVWN